MKDRKKKKEKKTSLLMQIGTLIIMLFAVAMIFNAIGIMVNQVKQSVSHVNETSRNLADFVIGETMQYEALPWILDYFEEKGIDEITSDSEDVEDLSEEEEEQEFEVMSDTEGVTSERAGQLSKEARSILCMFFYSDLRENCIKAQKIVSGLTIRVSRKAGDKEFVYFQGSEDQDEEKSYGMNDQDEFLGDSLKTVPYVSHDNPDYINGILHDYWFEGQKAEYPQEEYEIKLYGNPEGIPMTMSVYRPMVLSGETIGVVTVERTWTVRELFDMILSAGRVELTNAMYLLICGIVLLILVNYVAVKPLTNLQSSVRNYKEDKDTGRIVERLERIRSNNEIGRLATDVSELSVELDSYAADLVLMTAEKERIGAELDVAAQIQVGILPKIFPDVPAFPERDDFEIFASMKPAKEVGGDLYDFFLVDDDHLALVIGDVSGKGVPAALFMAITATLIRHEIQQRDKSIPEVLYAVNNRLCEGNDNMMFVTIWAGILELSTGVLKSANGGHDFPMIRKNGEPFAEFEEDNDISLGAMPDGTYTEQTYQLSPGDTLYLYTDGVPEAMDENDGMFELGRLADALNEDPDATPQRLDETVHERVAEFIGGADQFDDMTMLCVKLK